jgi:hypothetical protein
LIDIARKKRAEKELDRHLNDLPDNKMKMEVMAAGGLLTVIE